MFWAPSEGLYLPPALTRLLSKVPFAALMRVVRREYTVKLLLSYILVSGQSQWSAICEDRIYHFAERTNIRQVYLKSYSAFKQ